ncbi:hypothetical protein JVT61DRAFT_11242 [Boletus reticuloceps]|uniref:Uncharacterized protein n=1 Tax=Boletus reticuloceps TaxID=495285 RepID=A0A8I2YFB3_9AGAM|nr:hypothetical protein JVT61DRAFT_11242 [Boletus reticuloceps]
MVAPVPRPLPALEVSDPPTEFLDQTTVMKCVEIPTAIPAAIRDKIFPPEQLSLTKFIDFPLPLCILSQHNLDKYFAPLPPDTTLISDLVVALEMLPLPSPIVIHRLSCQAPSMWTNGSRSLMYPHTNDPRQFPFWILPFWRVISEFRSSQFSWRAVEGYLSHLPPGHYEVATF